MKLPGRFEDGLFLVKPHCGRNSLGSLDNGRRQGANLFPSDSRDRAGNANGRDRLTVRT